jgi:protease I
VNPLSGKRIAFLFTDGVEQVELTQPLATVRKAGAATTLVSLETGKVQMFNHLDKADTIDADQATADADATQYDGLVLPGGVANPDALRADADAVRFVRGFFEQRKPVGVICHGPWTLVEADVVRDRTLTSWPSLQTDLRNAGAQWVDEGGPRGQRARLLTQARRPAGVLRKARRRTARRCVRPGDSAPGRGRRARLVSMDA